MPLSGLLQRHLVQVSAERGARGVHLHVPRVGALVLVHAAPLQARDHLRRAVHATVAAVAAQRPAPVVPRMLEVHTRESGAVAEHGREGLVAHVAHGAGEHRAEHRLPVAQVAPHAAGKVVGERLDRGLAPRAVGRDDAGLLPRGHGVEQADGPRAALAGHLGGAEDARLLGRIEERRVRPAAERRREGGRAADPPRVEEGGGVELVVRADVPEGEDVGALEEEGALLGEEGLERGEVHHGRVHLHLAEVRVDGAGEGEPAREPEPHVATHGGREVGRVVERVERGAGRAHGLRAHVGKDLQAPRLPDADEPREVAEAGHEAGRLRRPRREGGALVAPRHVAHDLEAPHALRAVGCRAVAELRERDAVLCHPTLVVHPRRDFPHGVPVQVLVAVVGGVDVLLHAARVHREAEGGAPVAVGVDDHVHPVGVDPAGVAAGELRGDGVGA